MKTEEVKNPLVLVVEISIEEIQGIMLTEVLKHLETVKYTDREIISHQAELDMDGRHIVTITYKDYIKKGGDDES